MSAIRCGNMRLIGSTGNVAANGLRVFLCRHNDTLSAIQNPGGNGVAFSFVVCRIEGQF